MLAVCLTLALLLFWGLVGRSLLALLPARRPPLQEQLLSPVVGFVVTLLAVFLLNRTGIPVGRLGPWATAGLAAAAGLALWRLRPPVPWRAYLPFAAVLLLGLWLTGRPMLEFGFDWLSWCNDDMANYCLMAQRLYSHGFNDTPTQEELLRGLDYSQYYWFMHVPGMVRCGSDTLLAWVMSVTGLSAHQ